jgi:Zn-dependent peptidase ImmA (M78 family)
VDNLAPLVFINGKDSKSAQMFTLAHELVHIWLGESALSDTNPLNVSSNEIEIWCNRVAAEILVPLKAIKDEYRQNANLTEETNRLARYFKVSTFVILIRIRDFGGLTKEQFENAYNAELEHLIHLKQLKEKTKNNGGDFYNTLPARTGKRFTRDLIISTLDGRSSFTEAFHLLGINKMSIFNELGRKLGVII